MSSIPRRLPTVLAALLGILLATPPATGADSPGGVVWGRLAVEEESPDGAWTPLPGAEVQLYPASPSLLAELERIRQGARDSLRSHETAVARLQAALRGHQGPVEPAASGGASGDGALRGTTDPTGVFLLEAVPPGTWLLVVVRTSPYAGARLRAPLAPRKESTSGREQFVPRAATKLKEAEIWLTEVRVGPGERVALELTDRARWFAGPVQ